MLTPQTAGPFLDDGELLAEEGGATPKLLYVEDLRDKPAAMPVFRSFTGNNIQ